MDLFQNFFENMIHTVHSVAQRFRLVFNPTEEAMQAARKL